MKRKFIINPHSGRTIAPGAIAELERFFTAKTGSFDYAVVRSRADAIRLTRESLREGIDQVVAVGGDGTVNAVANGFFDGGRPIRPESCLAAANLGTGSDYFRTIAAGTAAGDWKELVLDHVARPVDIGRIRYSDPSRCEEYFLNMASAGIVADVVCRKERGSRWLPPKLRYLLPTVSSLLACRPRPVQLETETECLDIEVLLVSACKGVYAGHGMRFGGEVSLFDGLFDVTCVEAMGRVETLLKLRKLYTGSLHGERAVRKLRARKVAIRAPSALPVEFDGELGGTTDVELSVVPQALRICFPSDSTTVSGA